MDPAPATPTKRPVDVEARPVSPPRRKPDQNTITETMPAFVSQKTRDFVHIGREVGIFAILMLVFYFVLLPQNAQSIDNQKALQSANATLGQTNFKWAEIVEKMAANDAKSSAAFDALTTEVRGLRNDFREFKSR